MYRKSAYYYYYIYLYMYCNHTLLAPTVGQPMLRGYI